ncbi:MAG: nucleoside hydrolase [Oscillospiraceae bacterium]|nr:nucleoside hydrolase [Oscillospiraceae bacterium]
MKIEQYLKNLEVPIGKIDVVLDTDAYNEIDDQFAIAYLLRNEEKLNLRALYAAPFFNRRSSSPEDGMNRSYDEILKLLDLAGCGRHKSSVFRGSAAFLKDESTPALSDAAHDLAQRALAYSPERPLHVVAIGAVTNVASALLLNPAIKENLVLVWLGGHALSFCDTKEFNMAQDVAAARIVFGCGVPLVQLPCMGVVSEFLTTEPELRFWLSGKNALADYLVENTVAEAEGYAKGRVWSRVIWDVTAVAWLLNENSRFLSSHLIHSPVPTYDHRYAYDAGRHFIRCVDRIHRDALFSDLFAKLGQKA